MLVGDQVMCGLGRTGAWFAVDHWNVVPDLITMAKGLTSAYMPLGAVAMSHKIAGFYEDKFYSGGLTYNAHPMSLAAAVANLKVLQDDDLVGNSKRMGKVMAALLVSLHSANPSLGDRRPLDQFCFVHMFNARPDKEPIT